MKLEGKAFIVTGALGTIGGATAKTIIAKGGIACVFDIAPQEEGEKKVTKYHPTRALYFQTDIVDTERFAASCEEVLKVIPKGSLFGGVHCAAIAPSRKWSKSLKDSIPDFDNALRVNTYATFVVDACIGDAINSQYPDDGPFAPRLQEERGCIVNIASVVAGVVPARCITYGVSKTAVLGITSGMADFLGPYGIRVNSVSPAVVASALMGNRLSYMMTELEAACVFPHRPSEAQEVADGIIFLLENSMMNDFQLRIDGGWRGSSNWGGSKDPRENAPALE